MLTNKLEDCKEKCTKCYLVEGCMLKAVTSQICGGPWKDHTERIIFIQERILGIKKEKGKKADSKGSKATPRHKKSRMGTY